VRTSPEQVIVCAGFTHALTALTQFLIGDGSTAVAVEGYGHAEHRAVIERAELTAEPLPLDERGARVDGLTGSPARGVLLTPAHQFPTGVPLAADRRCRRCGQFGRGRPCRRSRSGTGGGLCPALRPRVHRRDRPVVRGTAPSPRLRMNASLGPDCDSSSRGVRRCRALPALPRHFLAGMSKWPGVVRRTG
jgi:hypothetical protein